VSTSLRRSQHGSPRRTPRKPRRYIGSPDWLGLGKTTIAYTICELLHEASLPFVSFFCQLDSRNSKRLVTTLCRDLAELYNSYAGNGSSILETNSKVVDAGLRIQIDELLVKPWQASVDDLPTPIVVVDALDESDRGTEFLEELLRVIHAGQLAGIKFLVTGLSMWNQDSPLLRNWRDRFGFMPSILLPRAGITIPLLTISTTDRVTCVAISPDGN
jgi:hypothetical protein